MSAIGNRSVDNQQRTRISLMWLVVALALLTAVAYLLIGFNLLPVGDLETGERPATIIYIAAGSYVLGGLLILARRRWLWGVGAVINALVILFFVQMYQERPAVLFSPGGLVSKAAQVLLEAGLLYLIIGDWLRARRQVWEETGEVPPASGGLPAHKELLR